MSTKRQSLRENPRDAQDAAVTTQKVSFSSDEQPGELVGARALGSGHTAHPLDTKDRSPKEGPSSTEEACKPVRLVCTVAPVDVTVL